MMQHVRESLCIFYPQESFSETFGLIYAEANAHETAIIASDIGAAREIMSDNNQPIDVSDTKVIIKTLKMWQKNYPNIAYDNKFSRENIRNQWTDILD